MNKSICVHLEVAYVEEGFASTLALSLDREARRILAEHGQGGTVVVYGVPLYRDSGEAGSHEQLAHDPRCHCGACWAARSGFVLRGDGMPSPGLSMNGETAKG